MGICELTQRMCIFCGRDFTGQICMEGDQIRQTKKLKACPQLPFRNLRTDEAASKMPA
jgi:hypothetical protein